MSLLGEPCKLLERENSLAFRKNDQSNLEPFTSSDGDVWARQVNGDAFGTPELSHD